LKYVPYTYESPSKWDKDVKNGIIYLYDNSVGVSPIRDLSMFRYFIDAKNASGTIDNYQFQPLKGDAQNIQRRIIPTITGRLHLSNTINTPINEAEIFSLYQADGNFTDLDITADYVTEANRALFIEYTPEGVTKELYCQKYFDGVSGLSSTVSYGGDRPQRLHYDFLGWVEKTNNDTYNWESNGSIRNEWTEENNECVDLTQYDLRNGSHTFIAVYSIHGYVVSYYMDDGSTPVRKWVERTQSESEPVTSVAISGSPVVFTSVVPWKDDSALPLKETYRFKGWRLSLDINDTKLYNNTTSRLTIDKNTSVYAVFAQESVYDNPLTPEEMIITQTGADTVEVTVPVERGTRGKLCFPSTIKWSPNDGTATTFKVTGLLGPSIEGNSAEERNVSNINWDGGNLSYLTQLTAVFFQGCGPNAAGPDYITEFQPYAFMQDDSLQYVDIPATLYKIGHNAFMRTPLGAAMDDLKNVYQFESTVFYQAFSGAESDSTFTVHISGKSIAGDTIDNLAGQLSSNAFNTSYIKNVVIGSRSAPVTRVVMSDGEDVFNSAIESITIYVTADVDQGTLGTRISRMCMSGANPNINFITV